MNFKVTVNAPPAVKVSLEETKAVSVKTEAVKPIRVSVTSNVAKVTTNSPSVFKVSPPATKLVKVTPKASPVIKVQGISSVGPRGEAGPRGANFTLVEDDSPQLGANLDVQTFKLFTSATDQDIMFTPSGTGKINLDGTIQFKRFPADSPPDAFPGGMYADDNDNIYFGVS